MRRTTIPLTVMLLSMLSFASFAGNLNPPAAPDDPGGAMYSVEDVYDRLDTGAVGAKRTVGFAEPTSGPGNTMHTLNDIMGKAPVVDNSSGANQNDVLNGKTFWGLRTDGTWGLQTGTNAGCIASEDCAIWIANQKDFDLLFNNGEDTQLPENCTIILLPRCDDADGDGISDSLDNCPTVANADQADINGDGIGDVCQDDADGDGISDSLDNCPTVANADQADIDGDGTGDVCEDDMDSYAGGSQIQAYSLNNKVRIHSGVSIVGFNPQTTRVKKNIASCRFEIIGLETNPVTRVQFSGWTFDGNKLDASTNGGAIFLQYVQDCEFNCRLVNHITTGNGGAIYGEFSSGIEAKSIENCEAKGEAAGRGGAAYGLSDSIIHAENCKAVYGGAVAECHRSMVTATKCEAVTAGGAAYRCQQIRLTASDCLAGQKGGAAYYCSDLMAEGFWIGNNAPEGPHIYASNHLTGPQEERHYWTGDWIGRRIDDGLSTWRRHNE